MGEAVDSVGEEEGGQAWAEPPFAGPALPFLPGPPGLCRSCLAPSLRFILVLSRCLWEMAANSQNRSCPTGPVALSFVPSEKGTSWVD